MTGRLQALPRRARPAAAILGVLTAMAIPATSQAAVTIGEETSAPTPASSLGCSAMAGHLCTFVQTTHPTRSYASPIDGVIVRWRIRGDSVGTQFNLRVVRKEDGTFTGAGTSEPRTVFSGVENVFDTQLPVGQGEFIGLNVPGGPGTPKVFRRVAPGATGGNWFPFLQDGETRAPTLALPAGQALVYNADVEPDCASDGFGDETQDPSTSSCHPRTVSLDANKNKVKKGKKVTLSGQIAETRQAGACAANQAVELQRKKPSQSSFSTVEQLQTDAAGSFSAKEKVKKTFEYQAQVVETAVCGAGVSNTEKVKLKKKN